MANAQRQGQDVPAEARTTKGRWSGARVATSDALSSIIHYICLCLRPRLRNPSLACALGSAGTQEPVMNAFENSHNFQGLSRSHRCDACSVDGGGHTFIKGGVAAPFGRDFEWSGMTAG